MAHGAAVLAEPRVRDPERVEFALPRCTSSGKPLIEASAPGFVTSTTERPSIAAGSIAGGAIGRLRGSCRTAREPRDDGVGVAAADAGNALPTVKWRDRTRARRRA
jgi:hypothetical protein